MIDFDNKQMYFIKLQDDRVQCKCAQREKNETRRYLIFHANEVENIS